MAKVAETLRSARGRYLGGPEKNPMRNGSETRRLRCVRRSSNAHGRLGPGPPTTTTDNPRGWPSCGCTRLGKTGLGSDSSSFSPLPLPNRTSVSSERPVNTCDREEERERESRVVLARQRVLASLRVSVLPLTGAASHGCSFADASGALGSKTPRDSLPSRRTLRQTRPESLHPRVPILKVGVFYPLSTTSASPPLKPSIGRTI